MNNTLSYLLETNNFVEFLKYKERLKIALKAAKICVFEVDIKQQLYTFFENAEDIFGVSGQQILKDVQPFSVLPPVEYQEAVLNYFSHPDDRYSIEKAFQSIFSGESTTYQARMKAGCTDFIWCKIDVTPIVNDGETVRMIGVITDISSFKEKTDILERRTILDSFTGLYNKNYSEKLICETISSLYDRKHALILIDLDNFKEINDNFGHASGDMVLKSISKNLKNAFGKSDIIGRFGGDEFIVFVKNISDISLLRDKLNLLTNADDNSMKVTKSIGVSIFPQDGNTFGELFEKADHAMYKAKAFKSSCAMFSDCL